MARIARTDAVLALLRERLQRGSGSLARPGARPASPALSPVERTRAAAAMAALDPAARRGLLVRALLAERLGAGVANDAAFQRTGDRVLALLEDTPEGRALIAAAMAAIEAG